MKKLEALLMKNPGYFKKGPDFLAEKTGLKIVTVERYRKGKSYKEAKKTYIESINKSKSTNQSPA